MTTMSTYDYYEKLLQVPMSCSTIRVWRRKYRRIVCQLSFKLNIYPTHLHNPPVTTTISPSRTPAGRALPGPWMEHGMREGLSLSKQ